MQYCFIAVISLLIAYCWISFFAVPPVRRKQAFTVEYMRQFHTEHAQAFPEIYANLSGEALTARLDKDLAGGLPDVGNGRYSQKLTYEKWLAMNNAMRSHMNFYEQISISIVLGLVAAVGYPWIGLGAILGVLVGRILFTMGYTMCGGRRTGLGGCLNCLGLLAGIVGSVMTVIKITMDLNSVGELTIESADTVAAVEEALAAVTEGLTL